MKNRFYIISVFLFLYLPSELSFAQATIDQLLNNGPTSNCVNIVILSEGYTESEKSKFLNDANSTICGIFAVMPYREYRSYFNAFALFIASAESGSDHPSTGIYRNTYFNSTFDSYGITRLLTIPPNDFISSPYQGQRKVTQLLQTMMPEYDIVLLLVNDPQYGGSGGNIAITSTHGASLEVALHEVGHSFAKLNDEYSDATPGYSGWEGPNTTAETRRDNIKWKAWIEPFTPIPTPNQNLYQTAVGLFEGACYSATGWYRPKLNCKMRSLNYPFCEVCNETHIKSIYNLIRLIDSYYPTEEYLTLDSNLTLAVFTKKPNTHSLKFKWYWNNILIPDSASNMLKISKSHLPDSLFSIRVVVYDSTEMVNNGNTDVLSDYISWIIRVNNAGNLKSPVLLYPPNDTNDIPARPTFIWSTINNASFYNLQISKNPNDWGTLILNKSGITLNSYKCDVDLPVGNVYYWKVNSSNGTETSQWSTIWKFSTTSAVGVKEINRSKFQLKQNYPNPFNPSTVISYDLPERNFVTLKIFDLIGREIYCLISGFQIAGFHQIVWNAIGVPSGIYYYRLQAGEFIETKKLTLMR